MSDFAGFVAVIVLLTSGYIALFAIAVPTLSPHQDCVLATGTEDVCNRYLGEDEPWDDN